MNICQIVEYSFEPYTSYMITSWVFTNMCTYVHACVRMYFMYVCIVVQTYGPCKYRIYVYRHMCICGFDAKPHM